MIFMIGPKNRPVQPSIREVSAQAVEKGLICGAYLDEVFGMQCLRHASTVAK
jgi:hypothetical protein